MRRTVSWHRKVANRSGAKVGSGSKGNAAPASRSASSQARAPSAERPATVMPERISALREPLRPERNRLKHEQRSEKGADLRLGAEA